jgi:hypothetical protein
MNKRRTCSIGENCMFEKRKFSSKSKKGDKR